VDFIKQRTDLGVIQVDGFQALVLRDQDGIHVPLATGSPDTADSTWETTLDRVALGREPRCSARSCRPPTPISPFP
jgi:hypothetical protein